MPRSAPHPSSSTPVAEVQHYFDLPGTYLRSSYQLRTRAEIVAALCGDVHDCDILDAGCGSGTVSARFAGKRNRLTLVDISTEMLRRAGTTMQQVADEPVRYVQGEVEDLDPSCRFDLILALGLIAHVQNPSILLDSLAHMLRPSGTLVLQYTDSSRVAGWLHSRYDRFLRKCKGLYPLNLTTRDQILGRLAGSGLILEQEIPCSFSGPGMYRILGETLAFRWEHAASAIPFFRILAASWILKLRKR